MSDTCVAEREPTLADLVTTIRNLEDSLNSIDREVSLCHHLLDEDINGNGDAIPTKPQAKEDNPNIKIRFWANAHLNELVKYAISIRSNVIGFQNKLRSPEQAKISPTKSG
jgi:hypothetical protein